MPSLSASFKIGGGNGVSSLVKSAASMQSQQNAYEDVLQKQNWDFGMQDQSAYATYKKYLDSRIGKLQSSGTVADMTKAQTLVGTSMTADRTFRSQQVQNATMGVLQGTGSDEQKAGLLRNLATQAYASGDMQNGQNIQEMYDRQILAMQASAAAQAVTAQAAGAKAQAAVARTYSGYSNNLKNQISGLKNTLTSQGVGGTYAVRDTDGKVLFKGTGANGYAKALGVAQTILGNVYNAAASDPGLSPEVQMAHSTEAKNLANSSDYKMFASPSVMQQLNNNQQLFTVKTDAHTGEKSLGWLPEVGQSVQKDKNGMSFLADLSANNPNAKAATPGKSGGPGSLNIQTRGGTEQLNTFFDRNPKTGLVDYSGKSGVYAMQQDAKGTYHKVDVNPATGEHVLADDGQINSFAPGGTNSGSPKSQQFGDTTATGVLVSEGLHRINDFGSAVGNTVDQAIGMVGKTISGLGGGATYNPNSPFQLANASEAPTHLANSVIKIGTGTVDLLKNGASHLAHTLTSLSGEPHHLVNALLHPDTHLAPGQVTADSLLSGMGHFFSPLTSTIQHAGQVATATAAKRAAAFQAEAANAARQMAVAKQSITRIIAPPPEPAPSPQKTATAAAQVTKQANFRVAAQPVTGNSARDVGNLVSGLTGGAIPGPGKGL